MKAFDYFSPGTVDEACDLLLRHGERASVLAGGTDLLVRMKYGEASPDYIIDLKKIPGLSEIEYLEDRGLRVGALASIHALESSPIIKKQYSPLAEAASVLGSLQIRNRGTVGGNLCHASPAADMAPPLMALDSTVTMAGKGGERMVKADDFFVGPERTLLKTGEILTEIRIPDMAPYSKGIYLKHGVRKGVSCSVVSVAVILTMEARRPLCMNAKIVMGAVAPKPIHAHEAEQFLEGKKIDLTLLREAANLAAEESRPVDDLRGSAWYRKEIVKTLVQRGIAEILGWVH